MRCKVCLEEHPGHVMCRASALAEVHGAGGVEQRPRTVRTGNRLAELEAMIAGIEAEKARQRAKVLARVRKHRARKRGKT